MSHDPNQKYLFKLQFGHQRVTDFKFELLPLHSPLLRQSLLVSFPPLIDMLKFSGYPCLIRGQNLSLILKASPALSTTKQQQKMLSCSAFDVDRNPTTLELEM